MDHGNRWGSKSFEHCLGSKNQLIEGPFAADFIFCSLHLDVLLLMMMMMMMIVVFFNLETFLLDFFPECIDFFSEL